MFKKLITALAIPLFLISCSALTGEEIGRLAINELSDLTKKEFIIKEVTLDLKKGEEIAFWSDMDLAFEGDVNLLFRLKILKDGVKFISKDIDPLKKNITVGEVKTAINGKTNWSFSGKNATLKIEEDATYLIKGILFTTKGTGLKIAKAELVIKK